MTIPDQTITIKLVVLPNETETTPEVTPGRIDSIEESGVSMNSLRALFLAAKRQENNPSKDDVIVSIRFDHLGYVKGWTRGTISDY